MNKTFLIVVISILLISCSRQTDKSNIEDEHSEHTKLCLINTTDSNRTCISYFADPNKNIVELLNRINLYNAIPDSGKYKGQPRLTITDTLGGGIITDSILLNGMNFVMDDFYYYQYSYNDDGLIKEFSYIDEVKAEDCIKVNYRYQNGILTELLAINPHLSTNYNKQEETWRPDTLYTVSFTYNNSVLRSMKVMKNNIETLYNTIYSK
ncbi:MAG: hypothetical protein JKY54_00270 [Flavobacteriales bacterium]|nr:hypothetical protein [Flavobacteriales bacterium]